MLELITYNESSGSLGTSSWFAELAVLVGAVLLGASRTSSDGLEYVACLTHSSMNFLSKYLHKIGLGENIVSLLTG